MFAQLFLSMASIFLMIAIGFVARRRLWIEARTVADLSRLSLIMFYPALIFASLVQRFDRASLRVSWPLPVGAVLIATTGFLVGLLLTRKFSFTDPAQRRAFHFQCATNNYSFLPMPLLLMLRGEDAVAALIFSSLGSEIALWTLGILALTGGRFNRRSLRHLLNVPFVALALALFTVWFRETALAGMLGGAASGRVGELGRTFIRAADVFGGAAIPLAMVVAGCRMAELRVAHLVTSRQMLLVGARLVLIPLLAVTLLFLLPLATSMRDVLLVVAVMPCAVTSVALTQAYQGDSEFAASSVFTTQVMSLISVPLWLSLVLSNG